MTKKIILAGILCLVTTLSFAQDANNRSVFPGPKSKTARIAIKLDALSADSSIVALFPNILINGNGNNARSTPIVFSCARNNRNFFSYATVPLTGPSYISIRYGIDNSSSITKSRVDLLNLYLVEPGDDISMTIVKDSLYLKNINKKRIEANDAYFNYIYKNEPYTIKFTGKGAAKYECRYKADRLSSALDVFTEKLVDTSGTILPDIRTERLLKLNLGVLNSYKTKLSSISYKIILLDLLSKYKGDWYKSLGFKWYDWHNGYDTGGKTLRFYENVKFDFFNRFHNDNIEVTEDAKKNSAWFPYWFIQKEITAARLRSGSASGSRGDVYEAIKRNLSGELRDKVITDYLMEWYNFLQGAETILKDALSVVKSSHRRQLEELQNLQTKGKPAFDFSLTSASGDTVNLHDFKGKVVFIDFWYTACSNCISYYQSVLLELEDEYKDNPSVKFVTINIDLDRSQWLKSVKGGRYTSDHAINLNTGSLGAEHAVIKHYQVTGYPRPLLIDKQGKIFSASASDLRKKEKLKQLIEEALKQ